MKRCLITQLLMDYRSLPPTSTFNRNQALTTGLFFARRLFLKSNL